ncbi:MAG: HmuY family protein [Spongiibacteraceae bacterium]
MLFVFRPALRACFLCCGLLLITALLGCDQSSKLDDDTTATETASNSNGVATRALDATRSDAWVYFNLADNAVVYPAQPENSREWDIAFQRFKIKTNSGVSGNGGVQITALQNTAFDSVTSIANGISFFSDRALSELSDSELIALDAGQFFAVCASGFACINNGVVDRAHLNPDTAAYALLTLGSGIMFQSGTQKSILGWYDYYFDEGHVLRPAGDTWLIKSVDGIDVKLEILGYYGLANNSEAGNVAFRYQSLTSNYTIPAAGAAQLKATINADTLQGQAPLLVQFSAQVSGGTAVQWQWDFGDTSDSGESSDNSANTETAYHLYQNAGSYVATLTVTDTRGAQASKSIVIQVDAATQTPGPITSTFTVAPSADTYVYQFLGNQNATPSDPLLVWAHESNHAAKILLDFDDLDAQLSGLTAGNFSATLKLYIVCNLGAGGFVQGCPGQPDADSSGGVATVITAIRAQLSAWQENDSALIWSAVQEGTQYATFTANQSGYWIDVDVTALVEAWRVAGSTDYGIVLTQQGYPVVRTDAGNIAVVGIQSRESSQISERPYLEIRKSDP